MLMLRNLKPQKKMDKAQVWKFFQELGLIDGSTLQERNYSGVNGAWQGQPAYVIGASPSLRETLKRVGGWQFFKGKHTIGINHTIEDFDGFEWHLFLDKRFSDTTTYNLSQFKGVLFANCVTGLKPSDKQRIFYTRPEGPSSKIEDGLFGSLSGLAAVNLAIISGANPIYLFGLDPGVMPISGDNLHYKKGYTGERNRDNLVPKMTRVMSWFDKFRPWVDRLRLVTDGGNWFPWMPRIDAKVLAASSISVKTRQARIVHLSFSDDLSRHADITRHIVNECVGKHTLFNIRDNDQLPDADLYIAEHFLSTTGKINAMTPEQKAKTIDIVHTHGCIPQGNFKRVVALTQAWKRHLEQHNVKVTDVVVPGIDLSLYSKITPQYDSMAFGRLTRWRPGKIHPEWNKITKEILDAVSESECIIYTEKNEDPQRPFMTDKRVTYDHTCQINMFKGDFLKKLAVYVHVNGSFKETLSFAVVEAMASGLPVVYLDEGTGVLQEVTGKAGVECKSIKEVGEVVVRLLNDEEERWRIGALAKIQAQKFGKDRMVAEFNEVIKACLK